MYQYMIYALYQEARSQRSAYRKGYEYTAVYRRYLRFLRKAERMQLRQSLNVLIVVSSCILTTRNNIRAN